MIDMFSGFAGTLIALSALGVRFVGICVERDYQARLAALQNFPNAVHLERAQDLSSHHLRPVLEKREFAAILVGGGAPCQGIAP